MTLRKFTEKEVAAIKRFTSAMSKRHNVRLAKWKIDTEGNLGIDFIYETNEQIFEDSVTILKKDRMNLEREVIKFKMSIEQYNSDCCDCEEQDDFGFNHYDMYRE